MLAPYNITRSTFLREKAIPKERRRTDGRTGKKTTTTQTGYYSEEGHGRSGYQGAVRDFTLVSQVFDGIDGRNHALHREEGGQIGRVRRDDDERKEPPNAADDPRRRRLIKCK